ncbi:MAG: sodium ion-translocating decarboxylase subunit beta [Defluviitoga tunisiensis]|jgi:sodium ion-translocating decarboxylase beta subunit|nr:sodium ion-translocating decarboxylase subunit beta [Defluviitoga tunisiensis]MDY0379542.1 sodium ion-translocating decarboxylase subunit beta [Defluviitoga tunisiensis]HHV01185.1 sodium ion-translocating decarboxylase subunit beta [Defluviitoga tunisiensis]HOB55083.1 sodium ion-translocating decarboxylase subunit beta [Defluviitoga tunisiensis]HOK15764.1 sodium ion-translocating decarboxylase subunit beta [Defluviitoga tunisiensis]
MSLNEIFSFFSNSGFASINWSQIVMIAIGLGIIYIAIVKHAEPLLLIPLGFGMIMANIPPELTGILLPPQNGQPGGLLWYIKQGMELGIYPPLIFLGIGALTDFSYLIADPRLILLGGAAQVGIFITFILASLLGFNLHAAASISIIGGADGPTAIYLASKFSPDMLSVIAIAAYSYISLIPILQPPVSKLLTTKRERKIRMKKLRNVSKKERILFPILTTILVALIVPQTLPLIGMLMLGNLLKESGLTGRLAEAASRYICDTVTILLMLSVGASATADIFLSIGTLKIILLGALAFVSSLASGIIFAKFMNLFSKEKINPLIGAAGVSAVPDSARVAQRLAQEADPGNFILMHAMGPNVAGVIGSAIVAGFFLSIL